jgi:hypothetical protein
MGAAIRIILAALLSTAVLMGWGFVFWAMIPWSHTFFAQMPDEPAVLAAMKAGGQETGVYMFPYIDMSAPTEEEIARFKSGPLGFVFYSATGADPESADVFVNGSIQFFVASLFAATLLCLAGPGLCSFASRWAFVTLLGAFAVIAMNLTHPIWFHHPWQFWLKMSVYDVSNWFLAGIVLAAIVRNKSVCCAPATATTVDATK